nr:hypothetical protein [Angustibacter aerolatus]
MTPRLPGADQHHRHGDGPHRPLRAADRGRRPVRPSRGACSRPASTPCTWRAWPARAPSR